MRGAGRARCGRARGAFRRLPQCARGAGGSCRHVRGRRLQPGADLARHPRRAPRAARDGEGGAVESPDQAPAPGRGHPALRPRRRRAGQAPPERLRGAGAPGAAYVRRRLARGLPVGDAPLRLRGCGPPRRLRGQRCHPGAPRGAAAGAAPRPDPGGDALRAARGGGRLPGGDGARSRPVPHRGADAARRSPRGAGLCALRRAGRRPRRPGAGGGRHGGGGSLRPPTSHRFQRLHPARALRRQGGADALLPGGDVALARGVEPGLAVQPELGGDRRGRSARDPARGRGRARRRRFW